MKRRHFIQSTLVATAVAPAVGISSVLTEQSTRLYGIPGSLTNGTTSVERFMLPISKSGVPVEGWLEYSRFCAFIEEIFSDEISANAFNENPSEFLKSRGMDGSSLVTNDANFSLLAAISQLPVRQAIVNRDYISVISYLKTAGVFSPVSLDEITKTVSDIVLNNKDLILSSLNVPRNQKLDLQTYKALLLSSEGNATPFDLAALSAFEDDNNTMLVIGAGVIVIAAVVAAVSVVAAVVMFTYATFVSKVSVHDPSQSSNSVGSLLYRSNLAAQRNVETAERLSRILGSNSIYNIERDNLVRMELSAFLSALKEHGLVEYEDNDLPGLLDATIMYTQKALK
jgi:hypothetical protein